jgi:hypothetical protein
MFNRLKRFTQGLFSQQRKLEDVDIPIDREENEFTDFQRGSDIPVLVVSGQKTGTHLLFGILNEIGFHRGKRRRGDIVTPDEFLGRKPNEYLMTHNVPDAVTFGLIASEEIKVIFNYRDPRDVIVSNYYWTEVVKEKDPASVSAGKIRDFRKQVQHNIDDKQAIFQMMIQDYRLVPGDQGLDTWFREPLGLFFHPLVYKTRFESLVGPNGGGTEEAQSGMIAGLLEFLDVDRDIDKLINKVFNPESKTFRRGKIGAYKDEFSEETIEMFFKYYGDILEIYGY